MGTEGFASQVLLGRECVGGKGNDSINMTQPACIGSWFLFDTGALREAAGLRYKGEDCNLEKLLYFYPDNTPGDDMKDRVGCCEALITFTSVFSPDKPCSAVHLEKQRHAYLQCEPGVWCVMEVNNPIVMTNGEPVYQEEELNDLWCRELLQQSWEFFRLFHGNMHQCWARVGSEETVRAALLGFMPRCLGNLRDQLAQYNILNSLDGITYLPVDKQIFLSIQYVVNIIEGSFDQVNKCAFLYDGQLVWSGFEQETIRTLYHMCVHGSSSSEGAQQGLSGAEAAAFLRSWAGCGATGNPVVYDADGNEFMLFLCSVDQVLAIFQLPTAAANPDMLSSLDTYVTAEVATLAKIMAKTCGSAASPEEPWKYIYFNQMNLALKSSLRSQGVPATVMRTLNEMLAHFEKNKQDNAEICVRQQKDGWIVGRKSNERLLFALLESKSSTLAEISEDLDQFLVKCFNNILI